MTKGRVRVRLVVGVMLAQTGLLAAPCGMGCSVDDRMLRSAAPDGGAGGSAGGSGSGGVGAGCTSANTARATSSGVIAEFADDSYLFAWGDQTSAVVALPSFAAAAGRLNIRVNQAAGPAIRYVGVGFSFPGCIDASAFAGVQFTISGSLTGCTMQYATNFTEDIRNDGTPGSTAQGSCPLSTCYSPQISVSPTATAAIVQAPWDMLSFYSPGYPVASPDDPAKLVSVQWQFRLPATGDGGDDLCAADMTISDLKFYH